MLEKYYNDLWWKILISCYSSILELSQMGVADPRALRLETQQRSSDRAMRMKEQAMLRSPGVRWGP